MKVSRSIEFEIDLCADELAELFCNMPSELQAEFFNQIAEKTKLWKAPFCFQLQSITDQENLSADAREIMHEIGAYAYRPL